MDVTLNVLLVDDEITCLDILKTHLNEFNYINIAGQISKGTEVITFLQKHEVDLILLDINIGDISGFDLAQYVRATYPKVMIIFLTGHADMALNGYDYQPMDFIVKPVNYIRLEKALHRAKNIKSKRKEKKTTQIGIHVDGGIEIVKVDQISYIERVGRKVVIVCENNEKFISNDSLQKLELIFSEHDFYRIHQSFLVPLGKIKSIRPDTFKRSYILKLNGVMEELPLSRDKYNEVKEILVQRGIQIY